jgi:hypothetical protein
MKKIILFLVSLIGMYTSNAQDSISAKSYKKHHVFDLAASVGSREMTAALSWNHLHGFGKKKQRFKVGYGLRYTLYAGSIKEYTTAPSKYTSTAQGLSTIFSETIADNIDTIAFANPVVHSVNLSIHLQYTVLSKLDVGFNIDAVGFSFGSKKQGSILSNVLDINESPVSNAKPTSLNLLLTSDNDIGSLNSEFYLRYWVSKKVGIKAGYTFYFSEYTTDRSIGFDNSRIVNDRYRLKSGLIMLAVSWKPFNN